MKASRRVNWAYRNSRLQCTGEIMFPKSRFFLICVLNLMFSLSLTNAQFIVKPMVISQTMAPGESSRITLALENQGRDHIQVNAQTVDLAKDKDGQWVLLEGDDQDIGDLVIVPSCRYWLSMEKSEDDVFDMEPGDTIPLDLEMQVPAAARGSFQAAVRIIMASTTGTGVRVRYAFVVPVLLKISSPEPENPAQLPVHGVCAEQMSALELIAEYQATQHKLESFISRSTDTCIVIRPKTEISEAGTRRSRHVSELRTDGERLDYRIYNWHDIQAEEHTKLKDTRFGKHLWDGQQVYNHKNGQFRSYLWDRNRHYEHRTSHTVGDSRVFIWNGGDNDTQDMNMYLLAYRGSELLGKFSVDINSIDKILSNASSLTVRNGLENVGTSDCHVIDAETEYGRYTVWIDAQHGYNIARAERIKNSESLYHDGTRRFGGTGSYVFLLDNVRFEKVDDIWIPMEADIEERRYYGEEGTLWSITKRHHPRTSIQLNPDHEAIGSFIPQIEEGSQAFLRGVGGIMYKWVGGKMVDSKGRGIDLNVVSPDGKRNPELQ